VMAPTRETRRENPGDSPGCRLCVRLFLGHTIQNHDTVAQMNVVAGHAYQPLHQDMY